MGCRVRRVLYRNRLHAAFLDFGVCARVAVGEMRHVQEREEVDGSVDGRTGGGFLCGALVGDEPCGLPGFPFDTAARTDAHPLPPHVGRMPDVGACHLVLVSSRGMAVAQGIARGA